MIVVPVDQLPVVPGQPAHFPEYAALAEWLLEHAQARGSRTVGIAGAQGTGKSTLAGELHAAAQPRGMSVATLSLDDFYLGRAERQRLAESDDPLLRTRGVPGTHEIGLLLRAISELVAGRGVEVPVFDKGRDDRVGSRWVDPAALCVVEGWCLGVPPAPAEALRAPINQLEAEEDHTGRWRTYVNTALAGDYARLRADLDLMVFLRAPDFGASVRWRREQEQAIPASHRMDENQLQRFMAHYERLSRRALECLPNEADVVVNLLADHSVRDLWVH